MPANKRRESIRKYYRKSVAIINHAYKRKTDDFMVSTFIIFSPGDVRDGSGCRW